MRVGLALIAIGLASSQEELASWHVP